MVEIDLRNICTVASVLDLTDHTCNLPRVQISVKRDNNHNGPPWFSFPPIAHLSGRFTEGVWTTVHGQA